MLRGIKIDNIYGFWIIFTSFTASTFEFNEILKSITDLNDPENCTLTSIPFQQNKCGMIWKEVNSISDGRCYTIEFIKNVTLDNPLEIILKFYAVDVSDLIYTILLYLTNCYSSATFISFYRQITHQDYQ